MPLILKYLILAKPILCLSISLQVPWSGDKLMLFLMIEN